MELYNPTANASVAGLSVVTIRSFNSIATTSAALNGAATGKYYLIANPNYNTYQTTSPVADLVNPVVTRTWFCQIILVNTANLPAGYVSSPSTYVFTNADFANGTQLIDSIQLSNGTQTILWSAQTPLLNDAVNQVGFFRAPAGGTPVLYSAAGVANAPNLSTNATPKAANPTAGVKGWDLY